MGEVELLESAGHVIGHVAHDFRDEVHVAGGFNDVADDCAPLQVVQFDRGLVIVGSRDEPGPTRNSWAPTQSEEWIRRFARFREGFGSYELAMGSGGGDGRASTILGVRVKSGCPRFVSLCVFLKFRIEYEGCPAESDELPA